MSEIAHEAIIENRSTVLRTWLVDHGVDFLTRGWGRWALALMVVLLIGGSVALGRRAAVEKPPLEIPASLEGRARMFTEAVARRNMEVMIRLTDPAQHRPLRIWLAHGTGIPAPIDDEKIELNAKIVCTTLTGPEGDRANLSVQLSDADGKHLAVDEQWARRGTAWYFQPIKFRSPRIVKGSAQPYLKAKRH